MKEQANLKELNIFQRMLKATEKISTVAKNLNVNINKSTSYKAVSESDVLDAVKPIETEFGIYSYPFERNVIETEVLETVKEYNGQKTESKQLFMRLEVKYRFVNVDKPDEYVDITTYGDGVDSQDKAPGKAMTYADKYALMKAYKIQTGEDPDKDPSGDLKKVDSQKKITSRATKTQIEKLKELYTEEELKKAMEIVKRTSLEEFTVQEASSLISKRIKEVKVNE